PGERLIQIFWLVAVAPEKRARERPAQPSMRNQRQEKRTYKLSLRHPYRTSRIPPGERQEINENRTRSVKQDIQWSGIFENPACGNSFVAQLQGQFGCCQPLRG